MNNELIQMVAQLLKMSAEDVLKYSKPLPQVQATYFWSPVRGGNAVIVAENGEKLAATSAVSFEKHLQAFIDGKRN